jgi:hypothetical protein
MEIRRTPLPGHVEYTLDAATECGEIDACTSSTLRLYGDPERLDAIVGKPLNAEDITARLAIPADRRPQQIFSSQNDRIKIAVQLMASADDILPQLEDQRRGALIHDGLRGVRFQMNSLCEVLADWALTDTVEGGSLEAFKKGRAILLDKRGAPYRRTYRMLCSPSYIRRYVKRIHSEEIGSLRRSVSVLTARIETVPRNYVYSNEIVWADMEEQLASFREHRSREVAELERRLTARDMEIVPSAFKQLPTHMDPKRRKLLKRASKIASSVLGVQAVNALARGDKIKVEGPTITLQMQKRGLLTDFGHGQLSVAILDHSGVPLADLCIYQDKVPVIDQAVGFALMIQSGMEKELVDESNIIRATADGEKNELIAEKTRSTINRELGGIRQISGRWGYETHRQWARRYWEETKPIWLDTVAVAVMGRNRKMFATLPI